MATTSYSPCKRFFFIHLDENQLPIPSTMFSKNNAKLDKGNTGCNEAKLPATQMTVPAGRVQCFHPQHFRYFYLVNSQTNEIVPNSFFSRIGKPRAMCTGINKILEYIIYK